MSNATLKVAELKEALIALGEFCTQAGDRRAAEGLLKLAEVMADKHGGQKVDKFLKEIRSRRGLKSA